MEIRQYYFLATAVGVHGLCIIGSYIFVKCFKNRLKVACMSEIIDKNIFRERNTLYTNSKTNNTKAIDNYRDDQLITI